MTPRPWIRLAGILVLGLAISSGCGPGETPPPSRPELFSPAVLDSAQALVDAGYERLDAGDRVGALTKFEEAEAVAPTGRVEAFHAACAYAHGGDLDEAFRWLDRLLEAGYDAPDWLEWEERLASLHEDPRFEETVRRARDRYEASVAELAGGLPRYDEAPDDFDTLEALEAWEEEEQQRLGANRGWLTEAGYVKARADLAARALAARRPLAETDWDEGLERVRKASRLRSPYLPGWGALSDLVANEAEAYVAEGGNVAGHAEALYLAGFALSLRYGPEDPRRIDGHERARSFYERVPEDSEAGVAARGLPLIDRLQEPQADTASLKNELRTLLEQHPDDERLRRALGIRLGAEAATVVWPIALEATDLDGEAVELAQYRGKVLLIDFWATWCPPCREELPGLVAAYETYHPKGLEVLSISLDFASRTTPEAYREWIDEHGMSWRHVYDGEGWQTPYAAQFLVSSIPAPFLVGKDGSLVAWGESCRGEELVESIERALNAEG